MNVASLAVAWARRRPFATLLNVALLAVGIATMTLVLLVSLALEQRMRRDAQEIDLVVGAKGSPLQLVLAGVFHVDVPPGNVPLAAVEALARNPLVKAVIPLSLGDSYRGYRIVGTEPALVGHYGAQLREGRLWQRPLEAVLGSEVARALPGSPSAAASPVRTAWATPAPSTRRRAFPSSACWPPPAPSPTA